VHGKVDDLAPARLLAFDQGEEDRDVGEAGGHVVRLVFRRSDRGDRVVVIAAAVEQAAGREGCWYLERVWD